MTLNITININGVETSDIEKLEELCEMMAEVCNTLCKTCDYSTVKTFNLADYELEAVE